MVKRYSFVFIEKSIEGGIYKALPDRVPNPQIQALVDAYRLNNNISSPYYGAGRWDEERVKRIADAYDEAWHDPAHPKVKQSYDALKAETLSQYKHLSDAGYHIEPWTKEGEPYKDSAEMMNDLRNHRHLHFFLTDQGFGTEGEVPHDHPLLEPSGVVIGGKNLLYNDLFRAIHDFYGHAAEGHQFGPRGEENAWRTHSSMFTPQALPALTAETRGQNSWVNAGAHLRRPDGSLPKKGEEGWIHPALRPFADQKATILSDEFNHPDISKGVGRGNASSNAARAAKLQAFMEGIHPDVLRVRQHSDIVADPHEATHLLPTGELIKFRNPSPYASSYDPQGLDKGYAAGIAGWQKHGYGVTLTTRTPFTPEQQETIRTKGRHGEGGRPNGVTMYAVAPNHSDILHNYEVENASPRSTMSGIRRFNEM